MFMQSGWAKQLKSMTENYENITDSFLIGGDTHQCSSILCLKTKSNKKTAFKLLMGTLEVYKFY